MALPISPPPKSDDVVIHGWSGITVRVAWTLLTLGVKVRSEVLASAREHVVHHLPPTTALPVAEDRAAHLTRRFVAQARGRVFQEEWPADAEMPLTERWVRAIVALKDRTSQAVFRMHYGDNRSLEHIANKLGLDGIAIESAREGLREVLRDTARVDGLPLDSWPGRRLDRVLERLAAWAPDSCPATYDVVNGAHLSHVRACPRCNRMVRLIHAGTLELQDLLAPTLGARPTTQINLLVLHLHPDGRTHRAELKKALGEDAVALGDDLLLVPVGERQAMFATVSLAAELGKPERQYLRGVVLTGPGGWSRFGPLGPLGRKGIREVGNRAWGVIDGFGALPEPLPRPPSAALAWVAVAALALASAGTVWLATQSAETDQGTMYADFVSTDAGLYAHFDVPEDYAVTLVALQDGAPNVVLEGIDSAAKASVAVGDGSYLAALPSKEALLITHRDAIDLSGYLERVRGVPDPLAMLADAVTDGQPGTTIFRSEGP